MLVKLLQKYLYWFLCTVVLGLILLLCLRSTEAPLPQFCIHTETGAETISIYDAGDGNCYVFLPSYARMESTTVVLSDDTIFLLDDTLLTNGMDCHSFLPNTAYALKYRGNHISTLWFLQSANVATVYLDTVTGSMEYIYSDQSHCESASMRIYTAEGNINHSDSNLSLKGRGKGTWSADKRPFSITLSAEADILEMGIAKNWVLLANARDETNLNNKLALDLARQTCVGWVPNCAYVDVYLNGEYNGLYLLSEKVEPGQARLDIDTNSGAYLCKVELNDRWEILRNPIATNHGRIIEISFPQSLSEASYNLIKEQVNQLEALLLSGQDPALESMIDLDSWVYRYLIDEITANVDSDLASSYFYYSDGKFFAGPIWDYDLAFGNSTRNQAPNAFIAKNAEKSTIFLSPYYAALYNNVSFRERAAEIYHSVFLPVLEQMLESEISELSQSISAATKLNRLRWQTMYDVFYSWDPATVHTSQELLCYLRARIEFLNRALIDNVQFCTVQFEPSPGASYWNISVEKGHLLQADYFDLDSTSWISKKTGNPFDFSQPITEDVILTRAVTANTTTDAEVPLATRDILVILSIGILSVFFLLLLVADIRQRIKERGAANGRA